jgi:hypothetical protein
VRTLTVIYRTKTEAKEAIKAGTVIFVTNHEGKPLPKASGGPYLVRCQLGHYKAWEAEAYCNGEGVYRLK